MSDLERQDSAKQLSLTTKAAQGKVPEGALAPRSRQTAERQAALAKAQQQATVVEKAFFPSLMAASVPVTKDIGASGFRLYLDKLLVDAGRPTDPIELMMIEQIALAHFRIAELHVQVEQSRTAEEAKVYSTAAVRLTGEFRRLALALRQYRQPLLPKRSVAFIKQQNVAAGDQQVAYLAPGIPKNQIPFNSSGGEQASRRLGHAPGSSVIPESPAYGGRSEEPAETRSPDAGRTRAAAASCVADPAVDEVDGTADRRGQGSVGE
ncbi:MAG: hypothetical protein NTY19_08125 [Planctomycetota bacterium]|nr:hypothetical protein [Planctomycetota bacterium]